MTNTRQTTKPKGVVHRGLNKLTIFSFDRYDQELVLHLTITIHLLYARYFNHRRRYLRHIGSH